MPTKVLQVAFRLKNERDYWILVEFDNGVTWAPSFEELARMIVGIGACEDIRYPGPYQKGRKKILELVEALLKDPLRSSSVGLNGQLWDNFWRPLAERFKLKAKPAPLPAGVQSALMANEERKGARG